MKKCIYCKKEKDEIAPDPIVPAAPQGITVAQTNTAIYNKLTATWCPPCGSWGWELSNDITADIGTDGITMATYGSSSSSYGNTDFYNQTAADFKAGFAPTAGWPAFCVNGVNITQYVGSGIDTGTTHTNAINAINDHKNAPVVANSGYTTSISGNTLTIETRTKFFADLLGEYYIGAYVIEDGVLHIQANQSGSVAHHHVLRGTADDSTWGELITSASTTGSTFDHTFTITLGSSWVQSNIEVATVIWKKNGSTYEFVNAHMNH